MKLKLKANNCGVHARLNLLNKQLAFLSICIKIRGCTFSAQSWRIFLSFFLSFYGVRNYTATPVSTMKDVVRLRSSTSPYSFCWRVVSWGHVWRTCSVVWSSSTHGHFGDCASRYFLYMCEFSLLCPVRSQRMISIRVLSWLCECFDDGDYETWTSGCSDWAPSELTHDVLQTHNACNYCKMTMSISW